MKKEKGFTLIEIIAVIIVLGIISLIAVVAVSRYMGDTEKNVYKSYEKSMISATKNKIVKCISGDDKCNLPNSGEKTKIQLNQLLDDGYIENLNIEKDGGSCDSYLSYVEIERIDNSNNGNYKYEACLYCGEYKSENANCIVMDSNDVEPPVCGRTTGESTVWTRENRTIKVKCSDNISCLQESFSQKFTRTTKEGQITISDINGNQKQCKVDVYVDKSEPTCNIEIVSGTQEALGWYSGNVVARITNQKDNESGLHSYGIGTSLNNRVYDNKTDITLKDGTTTVIGYVKDKVGNEGICARQIKVGVPKPTFDYRYGYQIYPAKEEYILTNLTESGTTLTANASSSTIRFIGLNKYSDYDRVHIRFNTPLSKRTDINVIYGSNTKSEILAVGITEKTIIIPKGTYGTLSIEFLNSSGTGYNINRIEIHSSSGALPTNKGVSINVSPGNPILPETMYSFDGGNSWQSDNYKVMNSNIRNNIKTKNISGLIADNVEYNVANIDKTAPTCTVTSTANLKVTTQKLTGVCNDSIGVAKVVWVTNGTPPKESAYQNVTNNISVTNQKDVNTGSTYTIFAMDVHGNVSSASSIRILNYRIRDFYAKIDGTPGVYTTVNYDLSTDNSYILPVNTTFSPQYVYTAPGNSVFRGMGDLNGSVTAQTISTANRTLTEDNKIYSTWFDRTSLTYKVTNSVGGSTTITALSNPSGTIINSGASKDFAIKYGDSVTIKPNSQAGYYFSSYVPASPVINNLTGNQAVTVNYAKCNVGTYSTGNVTSCTSCPTGYTSAAGAPAQTSCYINVPAGKYIKTANSSTPETCPAGTYKAAHTVNYGQTSSCTTCPAGYYCGGGTGDASACPTGYTSAAGATAQTSCYINVSAGRYLTTANTTTTAACVAGTYKEAHNVNYGQTSSCSTCAAGTYSTGGAGSCPACPTGYTSAAGATAQTSCYINVSAGRYLTTANTTTTAACAAGKYKAAHTVNYGQTSSCSTCAAGTYSTGGAGSCPACPTGYTSAAGATAQTSCYINVSAGRYLTTANTTTTAACVAGTYKEAHNVNYGQTSSCSTCAAGTYSTGGAGSCPACPTGYTSAAGATAQTSCYISVSAGRYLTTANTTTTAACVAGTYKEAHNVNYGQTSSCTTCPSGTSSNAGSGSCPLRPVTETRTRSCLTYNYCQNTACGWNSCLTGSVTCVGGYNSCATSACGCSSYYYNTSTSITSTCNTYGGYGDNVYVTRNVNSYVCKCQAQYHNWNTTWWGTQPCNTARCSSTKPSGAKSPFTATQTYTVNKWQCHTHTKVCTAYYTCQNSACGWNPCLTTKNTCVGGYNSCRTAGCGCESFGDESRWSAWTTAPCTPSSIVQCETRTVYR